MSGICCGTMFANIANYFAVLETTVKAAQINMPPLFEPMLQSRFRPTTTATKQFVDLCPQQATLMCRCCLNHCYRACFDLFGMLYSASSNFAQYQSSLPCSGACSEILPNSACSHISNATELAQSFAKIVVRASCCNLLVGRQGDRLSIRWVVIENTCIHTVLSPNKGGTTGVGFLLNLYRITFVHQDLPSPPRYLGT